MDFTLPQFVVYIATWAGITRSIWVLFDGAEKVIRPEPRKRLAAWLRNDRTVVGEANWPMAFADIFDRLFGSRHFSRRRFSRSCLASLLAVLAMSAILYASVGNAWKNTLFSDRRGIWLFALVTVFSNFIPDYLSLIETRIVIERMSRNGVLVNCFLIILDLLLTTLIFLVGFVLGLVFLYLFVGESPQSKFLFLFTQFPQFMIDAVFFWRERGDGVPLSVWLYSTFFTSIWVWMFFLSGIILKLTHAFGPGFRKLSNVLNTDEHPLRSLGLVCILAVTIAFISLPLIR